jgi:hypothetical protein
MTFFVSNFTFNIILSSQHLENFIVSYIQQPANGIVSRRFLAAKVYALNKFWRTSAGKVACKSVR